MKFGTVVLIICVFAAGVFFGIWLDWRHQRISFAVQDYDEASLVVRSGETISLVAPGSPKHGHGSAEQPPLMKFIGYSPCTETMPSSTCTIAPVAQAPNGPYYFICDGGQGYTCNDPGIQQSTTGPGQGFGDDVAQLFGLRHEEKQAAPPVKGAGTATIPLRAYVSCPGSGQPTALQDPNGNSAAVMNATVGQDIYWISPRSFTLSGLTSTLCTQDPAPNGGGPSSALCTVKAGATNTKYTVTATGCSALPAEIDVH